MRRLLPQIRASIDDATISLGYYRSSSTARFTASENCWQLTVQVEPGPRLLLDGVQVQVLGAPPVQDVFRDLLAAAPLRPGMPLHHGDYEDLKSGLSTQAAENGFFGARFEQAEIALDLQAYTANLNLVFDPGQQFRFGPVTVIEDGLLSEDLIRGLMQVEEGDAYSSSRLAELRQRLDASQYFRQVRVTPQLDAAAAQLVPVTVEVDLRPRHAWTGGLGFTTDTGPRARFSYENRFVNSRGHRLLADSTLSSVRSQLDGSYSMPLADAARQSLNLASGYSIENNDSFQSKRFKLETSLRNETDSGWLQSLFVEFQRDDYLVGTQEDISVLTMPGLSVNKSSADNLINPSSGWKLFAQLRGASDSMLSDASFVQFYGSGKHVFSFGRSRLLSRLELGSTWINVTEELPASLRYFAGGDQSIRGYQFRALGPLNEAGEVSGGKQLVVGSLEYDFLVRNNWRVAVFADSGNAFNSNSDFDWRSSAGIGVRWLSPIGPVRFDLAHPLNGDESFRFHITMGPDL
jgi:translocation and assembly module TamA